MTELNNSGYFSYDTTELNKFRILFFMTELNSFRILFS